MIALTFMMLFLGPIEEFGWRGFAQPILQRHLAPLWAGMIIGTDAKSPAGADIRFIMDGPTGNMIHGTVPPGQINRATIHATVSEFWLVLDGEGEIWRKDKKEEKITALSPGATV